MFSSLVRALELIDQQNEADPSYLEFEGTLSHTALIEGVRAHDWVRRLRDDAPEPLLIAARGHHLRRWEIPRERYPRTRKGYLDWRNRLYSFHTDAVAEVMKQSGYGEDAIERAGRLLQKREIKADVDAQVYEDALSLTFLELRLAAFMDTVTEDQLKRALNRTWQKMSDAGHVAARSLKLKPRPAEVLNRVLIRPSGRNS